MSKSPDAFRTISEVADWLGIQAHVLRFWESKFSQIKPVKRAGGRRYYRPSDMLLLGGIKKLLHDDGMTIKGAQKLLREQGIGHVSEFSQSLDGSDDVIESTATEVAAEPAEPDNTVVTLHPGSVRPVEESLTEDAQMPLELDNATSEETTEVAAHLASDDEPETTDPEIDDAVAAVLGLKPEPDGAQQTEPDAGNPEAPAATGADMSADSDLTVLEHDENEPAADKPRPIVVDISDPPEDTQIIAPPGALGALAGISRLTDDQADKLAPVAEELARWLDRQKTMAAG